MSTAREEMLRRIQGALRDAPDRAQLAETPLPREYRRAGTEDRAELTRRFIDRLVDYKAKVQRVTDADLPAAISAACTARGVRNVVVPRDLPAEWVPNGVDLVRDEALTNIQLDASDGVLTGCALAIAQTGTIILNGGPAQGRRAITLVPDYHLCVVRVEQIVDLVPEAITRLLPTAQRPITFISGPSATSDIELNRVEGVHGPRTLEVLIVGDDPAHKE